jgi:hypothetical protein
MESIFAKYDEEAQEELDEAPILSEPTFSGNMILKVDSNSPIEGVTEVYGDRLLFSTPSSTKLDIDLKWKQLDPFEIVKPESEENVIGFTIKSEEIKYEFIADSTQVLDDLLVSLEKEMILTDVHEDYEFGIILGSGSWGDVYKALNLSNNEYYAIKAIQK